MCRRLRDGDPCPNCETGTLHTARGIEMGHIFQLGRKFADALDLKVLNEHGKQVVVTMGSYGIGVSRAVAAIAESTLDSEDAMIDAITRPTMPRGKVSDMKYGRILSVEKSGGRVWS